MTHLGQACALGPGVARVSQLVPDNSLFRNIAAQSGRRVLCLAFCGKEVGSSSAGRFWPWLAREHSQAVI